MHAGVEWELPARAEAAKGERLQGVEQGGLPPALSPVLHQVCMGGSLGEGIQ